jgi:hypothetical protein
LIGLLTSIRQLTLHAKLVTLIVREEFINAHNLDRIVDIADAQIPNGSWNIEDEFANTHGGRENLWGYQDLTREQPVHEVVLELIFVHAADLVKHSPSLGFSGLTHHQGDPASIRPVAAVPEKDSAQLFKGKVVDRVGAIDNDHERLRQIPLIRGRGIACAA